ncbi:MAG: OmpA family protein [Bacteroidetes bacterium]|nr:OmpA family protein [Bacteroidota bacterium]
MKKILSLIFLLTISYLNISAQEFLPFYTSNYAGVTGIHQQPASIADSRYKFDISLSATSVGFYNNYMGIDPYVIWHPQLMKDLGNWEDLSYMKKNYNGKDKTGMFSLQQDLFSFMFTLSDKDAIAFTPSVRTILNFDNVSEEIATLADHGLDYPSLWGLKLKNTNFSLQANSWIDYGVTYARVIKGEGKHFMKAGATVRLSQGIISTYTFIKDLSYEFNQNTSDTLSIFKTDISYGASDNIYQVEDGKYNYRFLAYPSMTFDFGFVYEYRPHWMDFKYDMDGKTNLWRKDKEKYLFKLGVSITDIGSVHYRRNKMSRDFKADINNWYIGDLGFSSIQNFDSTLNKVFKDNFYDVPAKYNMNLPTAISVQADVNIWKGFYFNFSPYIALNRGSKDVNKVHYYSSWNMIPRYDSKWFGVSIPFQYTGLKQMNIGMGLRLGPIWIGSNDIISYLTTKNYRYGANVSAALKIPVMYGKPHDRDGDKVSNRKDHCPDVPGIWAMRGCPDTDLDGVPDASDRCPTVPGLKELAGCPDKDGDGITDDVDQCPDVKGLAAFNGCPDSDGDSIIDSKDDCPYNAGRPILKGCPDQDGDGIADKDDNCPTLPGTVENKGCPYIDSDGDGVKDSEDHCPSVKGPVENFGCPYNDTDNDGIPDKDDECPSMAGTAAFRGCPDTDGDGISDKYDQCPTIPGIPQNNGCPEIKKEEQEVINKAFDNLEFETGKAVIKTSSFISLDELAALLKRKPEFKLLVAGHTDNVGKPETNMLLSKNRTMAVQKYLLGKGIEAGRIRTEWYGSTKPIADNSTPEGRQHNRRVEMSIVFE